MALLAAIVSPSQATAAMSNVFIAGCHASVGRGSSASRIRRCSTPRSMSFPIRLAPTEITHQIAPTLDERHAGGLSTLAASCVSISMILQPETQYYVRVVVDYATGSYNFPRRRRTAPRRAQQRARAPSHVAGQLDLNETLRHRVYRPNSLGTGDDVLVTVQSVQPASAALAEISSSQATAAGCIFRAVEPQRAGWLTPRRRPAPCSRFTSTQASNAAATGTRAVPQIPYTHAARQSA